MRPQVFCRSLSRLAILIWLVLTVLGALNHTLVPGVLPEALVRAIPNLRFGYVMFKRNLPQVSVLSYEAGGTYRPIADWVRTPSPGYKNARVFVNTMMAPGYLAYLCAQRKTAREVIRVREYDVLASPEPVNERTMECLNGELHVP